MMKSVLIFIFLVNVVQSEVLKQTLNGATMRFSVPPIKAYLSNGGIDNETCIRWETSTPTSAITIQINRKDLPAYDIDENRFGPTSVQLGRQKLQLSVRDPRYKGDDGFILKDRNVPSNGRSLSFSTNDLSALDICFINLSYDSSWNAIDMLTELDVSVYTVKESNKLVVSPMAVEELELLYIIAKDSFTLVDANVLGNLVASEVIRRDLNESSYSWLFYRLIILIACLLLSYCVLVPLYLMKISDRNNHNIKLHHHRHGKRFKLVQSHK